VLDRFVHRLVYEGVLTAESGLHVGAGTSNDAGLPERPVARDAVGRPCIPGSALKGALRMALESQLRALFPAQPPIPARSRPASQRRGADSPLPPEIRPREAQQSGVSAELGMTAAYVQYLRDDAGGDAELARLVALATDDAGRLFGTPWMAGRVAIADAPVDTASWTGRNELREGVAIDRDTETAHREAVPPLEVVSAGTRFVFKLQAENLAAEERGLLMLGLSEMEAGNVLVGGGRSRGLGRVRLARTRLTQIDGAGLLEYLESGIALPVTPENEFAWRRAFIDGVREARDA
jgi:CRISPR-associated RAMP protein (TIGR02581 family)